MNVLSNLKKELMKKNVNNGLWLYFLQIFNTIFPLLTLPYITRVLETTQYGIFSIAINIIGYLQVCVEYGFGMSATREVALIGNRTNKLRVLFSTVIFARIILFVLCLLFVIIYSFFSNLDKIQFLCLLILLGGLIGVSLQQNWLFQGLQDMKYISLINIISRSISVVLIFVFVNNKNDLLIYCFLYSTSPFLSGLLSFIIAKIKFNMKLVSVSIESVILELKRGWYVFTTSLSSKVFGAIGITFLGIMADKSTVGIYSAIQKIPTLMMFMWTPISQIIFPIVSKKMDNSFLQGEQLVRKLRMKILPIFILLATIVGVLSKYIVLFSFGKEYATFYYWIIPLLLWMIFSINNNFLGIQILLASGHDKEYGVSFQIGVVITILSNFILIYFFNGTGASIAPAFSEFFLSIILYYQIKRIKVKYV